MVADQTPDRPLRVLMVCPHYYPHVGGTETHVYEVARRLYARSDIDVTVLTTDRSGRLPRKEVVAGTTVLRVPSWPRGRDYYVAPGIATAVGRREWDLVHCQGIHTAVPLIAMASARRAGIPYLVTFHTGGHSSRLRNAMRATQWRLIGPLLRNAASLIAVSRFEAELLTRHARLAGRPITVIGNGGALPPPRPGTTVVPGRIVSVGRLVRYKGHQRVIEALPHVLREIPEAHVLILGNGPYESELYKRAGQLGVSDRMSVRQIASADRQDMATALAGASVVAALSDYEAHPVAVMEALSVGRPVVGFDTAGLGELASAGLIRAVPRGATAAAIARELAKAISSPSPLVQAEFPDWDSCAAQLARVYLSSPGVPGKRDRSP